MDVSFLVHLVNSVQDLDTDLLDHRFTFLEHLRLILPLKYKHSNVGFKFRPYFFVVRADMPSKNLLHLRAIELVLNPASFRKTMHCRFVQKAGIISLHSILRKIPDINMVHNYREFPLEQTLINHSRIIKIFFFHLSDVFFI